MELVIYSFVYILKNTKRIVIAVMPAQGMIVRFALFAGSVKFGRMPGGGSKAEILDKSAPFGYNERSIEDF